TYSSGRRSCFPPGSMLTMRSPCRSQRSGSPISRWIARSATGSSCRQASPTRISAGSARADSGPPVRQRLILDQFARIGAPDKRLADPAGMAGEAHLAPLPVAAANSADDAGLNDRERARIDVGVGKQLDPGLLVLLPWRGDRRAAAGK